MKQKLDIYFNIKIFYFRLYRGYIAGKLYHPYKNRLLVIGIFNRFFYFDLKKITLDFK